MPAAVASSAHVCTASTSAPVRGPAYIDLERFDVPLPEHPQAPADAKFWADAARWKLVLLQTQLRLMDQVHRGPGVPSALAHTLDFAEILITDSITVSIDHHEDLGGQEGHALRLQLEGLQRLQGRPATAGAIARAETEGLTDLQKTGGEG
ncbi:hypothetical protein C8E08_3791 [Paracidovorax citrulli]|uniref:Uncharacterized protein n=1 Tax=Paracidovorax citrulli (strain AAC00-1) TaxID=397945 RepID=A1TMK5_PARC0|nr:hypothetical protein Aave_1606 [Paracidovorax citrulli AAC00-1]MVT38484.1 hypothetical protein [Paracidovorax citrulli]PVY66384.1 hypothetical protein C8E08_3791 [Paracidovorax citrulli]REG69445.1 hypothetical protein C8E07_2596 [Paracidovorax citrulli]RLJ93999.1 hypothetical protein C8E06_2595 [Paracidovorax citrulli]